VKSLILVALTFVASSAFAQVGKSQGVIDVNTASEQALAALPHMTAPVVKAVWPPGRSTASSI
jgi:DNA uptake protein ComE-like DNA-binding protein